MNENEINEIISSGILGEHDCLSLVNIDFEKMPCAHAPNTIPEIEMNDSKVMLEQKTKNFHISDVKIP